MTPCLTLTPDASPRKRKLFRELRLIVSVKESDMLYMKGTVQFNIYEVEHCSVEEDSLDDLRKAGCTNILVLLRDHERGFIRVACDVPEGVTHPNQLKLGCACL